ncbi:MAG: glycosyltransferase family 1 protein, partial [Myxococcaceae bacterium]|nr:glycosyltransferase family 1 protein [Myxococcaceae bacterium]
MRRSEDQDVTRRALRGRDLVVFSNDWDGDPLSKTHIMRLLARDNRILWVNSIGNRPPRADTHDLARIRRKLESFVSENLREVEPNIHVLSPLAIPLYGPAPVRALNGMLLRAQVTGAMRALHFQRPISWSFLPASAPVSGALG